MVVYEESEGRQQFRNGKNPFTTTDESTQEEETKTVIEIDGVEVLNVAFKSIIGGIATGLVTKQVLEDK